MSTRKRIRNQINSSVIQFLFSCLWEKDSDPNQEEKAFFDAINNITKNCQFHLESKYGPDLASHLNSPLYYKQIEYYDKRKRKRMNHLHQFFTPKTYLLRSKSNIKRLSLFSTKENKSVDPFGYLNQHSYKVKMALILHSIIFISKTAVSLHMNVHEVYVKPLKPRRTIKEIIVILSQVNVNHIRFFIVLFHLSTTLDFSSFSV